MRPDVGTSAWISCAGRLPWGQPGDQRSDDAWSLTYDWTVTAPVEILGYPHLRLVLSSSAPAALLSAKLVDVFPDGTAALVTRGLLNLTHRASSTDPAPLVPGAPVEVDVELEAAAYLFSPGHRIRLSIAGADWPNTWPAPGPVTLTIPRSSITFALPSLEGPAPISSPPEFYAPPAGSDDDLDDGTEQPTTWRIEHDVLERVTRAVIDHGTSYRGAHGARVAEAYHGEVAVSLRDPADATASATCRFEVAWPEAIVRRPRAAAGAQRRHGLRGRDRSRHHRGRSAVLLSYLAADDPTRSPLTSSTAVPTRSGAVAPPKVVRGAELRLRPGGRPSRDGRGGPAA